MIVRVAPTPIAQRDESDPAIRSWLEQHYAPTAGPYVRLNMITSLTGAATGLDGTSDTLTSRIDRTILGVIRAAADAVVVGAQTVRAERYIVPRKTRLAIVTATGDLAEHDFGDVVDPDQVMFVCASTDAAVVTTSARRLGINTVVTSDEQRATPAGIVTALAERGMQRLVCEGGPSLASQFAAAKALDEMCLTLAPSITPTASPFIELTTTLSTTVRAHLVDDAGFSYLRLAVRP